MSERDEMKWMGYGMLAGGSLGLMLGAGLGLGSSAAENNDAYSLAQDKVAAAEATVDEAEHTVIQVERRLGQTCVLAADIFLPGGQLADAPVEAAVTDLVAEPGQPCGDTRIETHAALSALRKANQSANESTEAVAAARAEVSKAAENQASDGIDIVAGAVGGLFGGSIGMLGGQLGAIGLVESLNYRDRRRAYKAQNASYNRRARTHD